MYELKNLFQAAGIALIWKQMYAVYTNQNKAYVLIFKQWKKLNTEFQPEYIFVKQTVDVIKKINFYHVLYFL